MSTKLISKKAIPEIGPALFIVLFVGLAWRGILSVTFQGEGFIYFSGAYPFYWINPFDPANGLNEDYAARLINHVLSQIFLDNIQGYFAFLFGDMLLTVVVIYFLVRVMVGSRLAAFFASLFFGLDYVANANMVLSGGFQYFIQRGVLLLPALLSLISLVKFTQSNNILFYFLSLVLYLITIIFGFFATIFLPVMVLYLLVFLIVNIRRGWWFVAVYLGATLSFILGNYYLIKGAGTLTNNTPQGKHLLVDFSQKIIDLPNTLPGFLQQLSVITLPFFWDTNILSFLKKRFEVSVTNSDQLFWAQPLSAVFYIAAFIFLWRTRPTWRMATIFSLAAFTAMLILNLFLNREQSLNIFSSSRYFYFPFSMGAIFWGLFFAGVFLHKKQLLKKIFLLVFLSWVGFNVYSIEKVMLEEGWRYKANRDMVNKIKEWSPVLKEKPYYLYFPGSLNTFGPGGLGFSQRFYGHPKSAFDFNEPELPKLARKNIQPEEIFVFRFDHQTHQITDETEKWREDLRKLEKNTQGLTIQYAK